MSYNNLKKQLEWAWSLTGGYRGRMSLYMAIEVLGAAFSLAFVFWSKRAVDITVGTAPGHLKPVAAYMVLSAAFAVLAGLVASWLNGYIQAQMLVRLQNQSVQSLMSAAWKLKKRWYTGDLMVRLNADCPEIVQLLAWALPSFGITVVKLAASLGLLWAMDQTLAWMVLSISPLFLFSKLYYRKMRWLSQAVKQAESRLGAVLQENLKFRLLIRALQASQARRNKMEDCQDSILSLKMGQLKFSALSQGMMKAVFNGGYLLAFIWGIYRLHEGQISFGTMTAFLQLVGKIQMPVLAMIAFIPVAIRGRAAIERLMELDEGEKEVECGMVRVRPPLSLRLRNVSFRYDDRDVIDGFNAVIHPGKPAAIVGSSGKGKTTLIRLMLALIKPDRGEIVMETPDGTVPVSAATRANFAYVPQGNSLFSGTIRENLLLADPSASAEQLQHALETACAGFVYLLPDGLDTTVGESGYGLSEGQAQRIAITRALLCDSPVWLFDEITSALDSETSQQLVTNIMQAGREKTMIFVTHDRRLAGRCTQIITTDPGANPGYSAGTLHDGYEEKNK